MNEQEDFIVAKPYTPTEEEKKAIAELEAKGIEPKDWNSKKKGIVSFKNNLRKDMYAKQNKLCAYCRIHIPISSVPMHIEHIAYKDAHPQWMFLPENLCLACPKCNSYKSSIEALENPQTNNFPRNGKDFKIIHPLYDRYSDHIELVDGILYRSKTPKGRFTINTCQLYRVNLAEERVDQMWRENKGKIISGLLNLLSKSQEYVDDNMEFIQYVSDIVKKFKQENVNTGNAIKLP